MIVCLCHGVSERVVDECIDAGAATVTEVGLMSGAGMSCGACKCTIEDRIACSARSGDTSHSHTHHRTRGSLPIFDVGAVPA
jgi:bacterioferritin-associated ferredoxin